MSSTHTHIYIYSLFSSTEDAYAAKQQQRQQEEGDKAGQGHAHAPCRVEYTLPLFFLEASQLGAVTIFHLSLSLFFFFPSSSLFTSPLFLFNVFSSSSLSLSLFFSPLLFLHFSPLFSRNPFILLIFPWNHPSHQQPCPHSLTALIPPTLYPIHIIHIIHPTHLTNTSLLLVLLPLLLAFVLHPWPSFDIPLTLLQPLLSILSVLLHNDQKTTPFLFRQQPSVQQPSVQQPCPARLLYDFWSTASPLFLRFAPPSQPHSNSLTRTHHTSYLFPRNIITKKNLTADSVPHTQTPFSQLDLL
ncbi:MAG: hypothetical protein BYD32DRAFT_166994 [Podila humilis]|nr:MAG: hypothetical protein BYD32DRAFT_166994 [Podila humilis]